MKLVYSSSDLTIAAAAGAHADHGIPGISIPRKHVQYSEVITGLRLATMFPSFTGLETSSDLLWNTRGWTFQEKLLTKRMLLLTDYQVYFKCAESIWTEEIHLETEKLSKSVEARQAKYLWKPGRERHSLLEGRATALAEHLLQLNVEDEWDYLGGFLDYTAAVAEFSRRNLTNRSDTLFAISGVLDTLRDITGDFTLGLPRKHFLESLMWFPEVGCVARRDTTQGMPSWT